MWKNVVEADMPQMTIIRRIRFEFWITKAADTHSWCVILFAFPWRQWLHERTLMLDYTYIARLVFNPQNSAVTLAAWSRLTLAQCTKHFYMVTHGVFLGTLKQYAGVNLCGGINGAGKVPDMTSARVCDGHPCQWIVLLRTRLQRFDSRQVLYSVVTCRTGVLVFRNLPSEHWMRFVINPFAKCSFWLFEDRVFM